MIELDPIHINPHDAERVERWLGQLKNHLRGVANRDQVLEIDDFITHLASLHLEAQERTAQKYTPIVTECARDDWRIIQAAISGTISHWRRLGSPPWKPGDAHRTILIDASHMSPVWRGLPGGRTAYAMDDECGGLFVEYENAMEEYIDGEGIKLIGEVNNDTPFANGRLYWEEGCLYFDWSIDHIEGELPPSEPGLEQLKKDIGLS